MKEVNCKSEIIERIKFASGADTICAGGRGYSCRKIL